MTSNLEYYKIIGEDLGYKYASFWKRFVSFVIDLLFIYSTYFLFIYLLAEPTEISMMFTFFESIIFQFIFYKSMGKSLGDMLLKIKPVFQLEETKKNKYYLIRAACKSTVYVPFGISNITMLLGAAMVIVSVLLLFDPKLRKKHILSWDFFSRMIVIDER